MNNFEPKYIKISAKYLQDKLQELQVHSKQKHHSLKLEEKKESAFSKLIHGLFQS